MANDKTQFLFGFILGLLACALGTICFLVFVAGVDITQSMLWTNNDLPLGKLLALGCVFNFVLFFGLLKLKKEFMAKGVIMSVIVLAICSIFL